MERVPTALGSLGPAPLTGFNWGSRGPWGAWGPALFTWGSGLLSLEGAPGRGLRGVLDPLQAARPRR